MPRKFWAYSFHCGKVKFFTFSRKELCYARNTYWTQRFDLSTNNSVNVSYATEIQWKNDIHTNNWADQSINVMHEDSKNW